MGKPRKPCKKDKPVPITSTKGGDSSDAGSSAESSEPESAAGKKSVKGRRKHISSKDDDLKELLKQLRNDIQTDMRITIAPIKEALAELKVSMKQIETTANEAFELAQQQQIRNDALEKEITFLKQRIVENENRDRQNNLRLRHFKEGEQGADLKGIILKWLQSFCLDMNLQMNHIEGCHRTGPNQGNLGQRDILVRFAFYTTKMDVYRALNKVQNLNYEGEEVEIYQDLGIRNKTEKKELERLHSGPP
ncbi:hypothetical protein JRQ81_008394 [Phrynocephalus forsythii]|uniref:Uncharacterized protein n=1 Tax=Phrynocephalus forsythii TaxID=171643 RepID=A0A9Q0Y4T8_9SAUR|nr:hypothetical protein JRQ81_008394 [Phrynocephalus forsythii]